MNKSLELRQCNKCEHFGFYDAELCAKGHQPLYFHPVIAVDASDWGYKRKCEEFADMKE